MSFEPEKIYRLLPAAHRLRDHNAMGTLAGNPTPGALEELVGVLAEQVAVLEEELEQLYDNQFVETAAAWALPYLADLLGVRGLDAAGLTRRFSPRAEVANTIAYRRRKGTAAMMEQLACDISGGPASAVEFWQRLATTQYLKRPRPSVAVWASVRNARQLELFGTPFEAAFRTVEVRRIEPRAGKWDIPNIGIFVWRLRAQRRTWSPLVPAAIPNAADLRHFRLHPLGLDVPLCLQPEVETEISHLAGPENVPLLLTRRFLAGDRLTQLPATDPPQFHPDTRRYGELEDSSVAIATVSPAPPASPTLVPDTRIVVCDLHDVHQNGDVTQPIVRWGHDNTPLAQTYVLLDPQRGRVVVPPGWAHGTLGTYHFLAPAEIGGGEYARTASFDRDAVPTRTVAQQPPVPGQDDLTVAAAIAATPANSQVIEIRDSGRYAETLPALVAAGRALEVRGADGAWPVVILGVPWRIDGELSGTVTLNGLTIAGAKWEADGVTPAQIPIEVAVQNGVGLGHLRVRHCTLVPGLSVGPNGRVDPAVKRRPALVIRAPECHVALENCIVGPLLVAPNVNLTLRNCIVDAGASSEVALGGLNATPGTDPKGLDIDQGGFWRIENCTVLGRVAVRGLELASNSIFCGDSMTVQRRQEGCVRFCSLPENAIVPRRHACVPPLDAPPGAPTLRPEFGSRRFGDAAYCQLRLSCPDAIRRGADDGSEMGAYHDLLEPRREAHLRARLNEYLRFGLEAGIFPEQRTPQIREP